jgi:tyrosyl-tRNA synthetase
MTEQMKRLWVNVTALSEKHLDTSAIEEKQSEILNNDLWLQGASIMEVLGTIGSGLRLGPMLGRDT